MRSHTHKTCSYAYTWMHTYIYMMSGWMRMSALAVLALQLSSSKHAPSHLASHISQYIQSHQTFSHLTFSLYIRLCIQFSHLEDSMKFGTSQMVKDRVDAMLVTSITYRILSLCICVRELRLGWCCAIVTLSICTHTYEWCAHIYIYIYIYVCIHVWYWYYN